MTNPDEENRLANPEDHVPSYKRHTKGPLYEAYVDHGIERDCTDCGATADTWCINALTGQPKKVPCRARLLGLTRQQVLDSQKPITKHTTYGQ